jgi:phage terminase large subunit
MLISIDPALPELSELLVELSQPTFTTTAAGKLQVVKTPPGTKSPDRVDAVCIAFGPASRAAWAATWIRLAG